MPPGTRFKDVISGMGNVHMFLLGFRIYRQSQTTVTWLTNEKCNMSVPQTIQERVNTKCRFKRYKV